MRIAPGLICLGGQALFEQLRKTFGHEYFRGHCGPLSLAVVLHRRGVVESNRASGAAPLKTKPPRLAERLGCEISLRRRRCGGQLQHARDDRIDRHRRGIHDHGVVGGPERGDRAACVAPIALGDLQRKGGEVSTETLVFQLVIAPARPLFGAGGQEDLEGGGRGKPPCPCRGRRRPVPGARQRPAGAPAAPPGPPAWPRPARRPRPPARSGCAD